MARSFNNPGNIRAGQNYAGETGENYKASDGSEYVVFDTKEMGLRALFVDLRSKVKEFDGDIDKIINKYAPPSDKNPTKKYAEFVKSAVGKDKVTLQDLPKLVSAVVRFENKPELAKQYLKPDVINTAYQLSEKNMPKQTRLADAKKIIGMPDTATIDQKLPSETILSVVPPKPDAREGRVKKLNEAKDAQEFSDLGIIETRQQGAPKKPDQDDLPIIEDRVVPTQTAVQEELPIIEDRVAPTVAQTQEETLSLIEDRNADVIKGVESNEPISIIGERNDDFAKPPLPKPEPNMPVLDGLPKPLPIQPARTPFQEIPREVSRAAEIDALYKPDVTFSDAAKAAFKEDNLMSWIFNGMPEYEPDYDFRLNDEQYAELTKDIPIEYHDFLEDSVSMKHAEALRERVLLSMDNEKKLSEYGWSGVGLRIVASILDPAAIGASVLTEGYLAPMIWGSKATRLARAVRGAAGGAVTNSAIEAYLVSQNAVKDPYDILYGFAGGLILGGSIGAAFGKNNDELFRDALVKIDKDTKAAQTADVSQAMQERFGGGGLAGDQTALPSIAFSSTDTGVGAAINPMSAPIQIPDLRVDLEDMIEEVGDPPQASWGKLRFDMTGALKSSPFSLVRKMGNILGEDSVGFNRGGEVMESTADLLKTNGMKATLAKYYQVYDTSYKDWAKSNGIGYFRSTWGSSRSQFGELVADAIENPNGVHDPNVVRAAQRQAELFRDTLRKAKDAGVKGFDSIPEDLTYFTHLWDAYKFRVQTTRSGVGGDAVKDLLKNALLRGTPDMAEDLAQKMSENMIKKMGKAHAGMESGLARVFTTTDKDTLRDILVEEEILSLEEADRLIGLFDRPREGLPSRAKRRMKLDINTQIDLPDGSVLRVKDLMSRDAEQVFSSYQSQMQGRIALAEKGIKSDADYNKMIDRIRAQAAAEGDLDAPKKLESDIENMDVLYNLILGRSSPLVAKPDGTAARLARLAGDYNFIRLMNQVGFAQIGELGNAISIGGFRGLLQVMPEMRSMLKRGINGEIDDAVARDLEAFAGIGSDRMIHQAMNRYDAQDLFIAGRGDFIDKASFAIQPVKRIVSDLSGMAPITLTLERAAGRMAVQTITDMAFTARKLSAKRIAGLGLNENMTNRILDQIRTNAVTSPSTLFRNRKVRAINLDAWEDVEARDAFVVAISRWTRQAVQQNDVGNLNKYMTTTMGKMVTQFRTFMLVSWSKQFLHNITARDFRAFSAMMGSVFFAGTSYIGQTSLNAQFREDKDKFLEERLSAKEIGKAAFQRSSWASLFPAMLDTGAAFVTEDPIFAYGRTTGLATNIFTGIPVVDLGQKAFETITGASRAIINPEYQWSRGQQRALNSIAPLQNAIVIRNVMNKLVEMQPKYDTYD
jgi:hypothetical protein